MTFAVPAALALIALIPLHFALSRRGASPLPMPRAGALSLRPDRARLLGRVPQLLRAIALVALVLAIAGPATAGGVVEERSEGVPIVLAIDISSSMLAQDFAPRDRLTVAKSTTARFVEARTGDPIGVVAFAGEALTLVPATTYRPVVGNALES
ncbi:MAG TPA: VWA domain-containing protein, partial [Longimicrobiaceae bacterium]|nr:VWA domain-containing protein [Longimicrobiaceae bacterium]